MADAADEPLAPTAAGIFWMTVSIGGFMIMDGIVKYMMQTYSMPQVLFFRNAMAFLPLLPFLLRNSAYRTLRTQRPFGHLLRCLLGVSSMALIFLAFKALPLATAISFNFAAPLMMTALSVPFLKEQVGWRRWTAVAIGFVGVLVIVNPGSDGFQPAALLALGSALSYAMVMIIIRKLSTTESSVAIVFYFTLAGTVISGAVLPFNWITPTLPDLALLCLIGLLGGLAQIAMTHALRVAPVSVLAPFEYTALLWAVALDIAVWSVWPTTQTLVGAAIISATGLYIVHRETRRGTRQRFGLRMSRVRVAAAPRAEDEAKP